MATYIDLKTVPLYLVSDIKKRLKWKKEYENLPEPYHSSGQLKLFLGELEFLSWIASQDSDFLKTRLLVVYLGSAPGIHITSLLEICRPYDWVLVDPREHAHDLCQLHKTHPFRPTDKEQQNLTLAIHNIFATPETIKQIVDQYPSSQPIVLISDIRHTENDEPVTEDIVRDTQLQLNIAQTIKPIYASFKWRCPFRDQTEQNHIVIKPIGKEYLQCWGKFLSAEIRIFSQSYEPEIVGLTEADSFEEKLLYYNICVRRAQILNSTQRIPYHDFILTRHIVRQFYHHMLQGNFIFDKLPSKHLSVETQIKFIEKYFFEKILTPKIKQSINNLLPKHGQLFSLSRKYPSS